MPVLRPRACARAWAMTVALVAALALSGCSASDGEPSATPGDPVSPSSSSPSGSAKDPTTEPTTAATYAALGDSYTAAPGVPETDPASGCLRSDHNYPHLVAEQRPELVLDDVSCSGARTLSLVGVQQAGTSVVPAQFDALSEATTLVTLGIGGNDDGLFQTLITTCVSLAQNDPAGNPCQTQVDPDGTAMPAEIAKIGARLTSALQGVQDRAPNAQVLMVGYPQSIPAAGTCDILPLAAGDYPFVRQALADLDSAMEKAAAAAGTAYVDVLTASDGHDICAGDQAWINGNGNSDRAIAFHPFIEEQQAVADLILATFDAPA